MTGKEAEVEVRLLSGGRTDRRYEVGQLDAQDTRAGRCVRAAVQHWPRSSTRPSPARVRKNTGTR